jgi:hypothetical protein
MNRSWGSLGFTARAGLGLVLLLCFCLARAQAHPFGQQYYALRSEVRFRADGPQVVVGGEVPIMVVLTEFRHHFRGVERPGASEDAAYFESKLEQLREGLELRLDGQPVEGRWLALDDPRNGKSAEGSFTYFLRFEPSAPWALGGDGFELSLHTEAYEGKPLWFSSYAISEVEGWEVSDNSARALIGAAVDDPEGMLDVQGWSQDDAMRETRLVFQHVTAAPEPAPARGGCWF